MEGRGPEASDEDLAARAAAGAEAAFEELVRRYHARVYRLAYRVTGDGRRCAGCRCRRPSCRSTASCPRSAASRGSRPGSTASRPTPPSCSAAAARAGVPSRSRPACRASTPNGRAHRRARRAQAAAPALEERIDRRLLAREGAGGARPAGRHVPHGVRPPRPRGDADRRGGAGAGPGAGGRPPARAPRAPDAARPPRPDSRR